MANNTQYGLAAYFWTRVGACYAATGRGPSQHRARAPLLNSGHACTLAMRSLSRARHESMPSGVPTAAPCGFACHYLKALNSHPHSTQDLSRAWRVAERLEYGMVGVNETAITSEVSESTRAAPPCVRRRAFLPGWHTLAVAWRTPGCRVGRLPDLHPSLAGGTLWRREAERPGAGAEQVRAGRVPGHQDSVPGHWRLNTHTPELVAAPSLRLARVATACSGHHPLQIRCVLTS